MKICQVTSEKFCEKFYRFCEIAIKNSSYRWPCKVKYQGVFLGVHVRIPQLFMTVDIVNSSIFNKAMSKGSKEVRTT